MDLYTYEYLCMHEHNATTTCILSIDFLNDFGNQISLAKIGGLLTYISVTFNAIFCRNIFTILNKIGYGNGNYFLL